MRQWTGLREDLSVVSDEGLATATNVSFAIEGELRRRPGLADRVDESGILVTEWTDPFGDIYLVYNSGSGTLRTVKTTTAAETTVSSGLNTVNRGCFAKSNGRIYFVNDFDAMVRVNRGDSATETVGIAAPSAAIGTPTSATTGVVTVGTHGLRYRYFDSKSLYISDPSPQTDITTVAGVTLTFDITATSTGTITRSTDAKVDQVIIEMTDAGSSTFYRAATVNQTLTGTTVSITDTNLRNQVTAARDGDYGHQQPPLFSMAVEHRGRMFGWGSTVYAITGVTTNTGNNVTVTGATMSVNWAGRLIKVGSDTKAYRISAMSGTSTMVLSEQYTGSTGIISGAQVYSATPDMLYWSRAGFPESYQPTSFARRVLQNQSDVPSGLASYSDTLYLFGQRTIRLLDYAADPATGSLVQVATEMGLWNKNCLIEANGRLFGWGRSGAWAIAGLSPQHISRPIDRAIDGSASTSSFNFDASKKEQFHGQWDPRERVMLWYYCTSDDTYPKHAIVFDPFRNSWSVRTYKQAMRASCLTTGGSTDPTRALVADENGYSWYLTADTFDGVPSSLLDGVLSVYSGSTTVITTTQSLPTGTGSLAGIIATTSSGAERLISSNTANTLTVSSAFAAAPSPGSELFLGQINWTVKTRWLAATAIENKKRPSYCLIKMVPGSSSGKIIFNVFLDYATSAYTYTKGSTDTDIDGVTITNGSADVVIDNDGGSGDGIIPVQLPAEWNRVIAIELRSTRPTDLLKVLDIDFFYQDRSSIFQGAGD